MRKIMLILATLVCLFSVSVFGQQPNNDANYSFGSRVVFADFQTLANSVDEYRYVSLEGWSQIDSISIVAFGTGELDVDSVTIYAGTYDKHHNVQKYSSTVLVNCTVTINVAAAADAFEQLYVSGAAPITGTSLRGVNSLKVLTRGAASGNDPADPNRFVVGFHIWGVKTIN